MIVKTEAAAGAKSNHSCDLKQHHQIPFQSWNFVPSDSSSTQTIFVGLRPDVRFRASANAAGISGFQNKTNQLRKNFPSRLLGGLRCLLSSAREAGPVHLQQAQTSRMSNTSQKHRDFVGEPMGDKPVSALAGIGEILGKKLEHQGFDKAYVVLGQFLLLKKDGEMFTEWLKDASGANSRQAGLCALCLKEWCDAFL
ncbi:uncharacterized protein AB9X84_021165 isoform 2-T2 [Acanthopagrus schlegelii]